MRRVLEWHSRHTFNSRALHNLLSSGPERAREVLSIMSLPLPPCPLHGPCSLRSLKDNDPFSKERGKKRARVSKHCLFADGMSKKKRLINQNGQESLLFLQELAYLSSLSPFSPPFSFALDRSQRSDRGWLFMQVSYNCFIFPLSRCLPPHPRRPLSHFVVLFRLNLSLILFLHYYLSTFALLGGDLKGYFIQK